MALIINGEYVGDDLFFEEFRHLGGTTIDPHGATSQQGIEILQHAAEQHVLHRVVLRQMALREGFQVSDEEVEKERRQRWGSSSNTVCGTGVLQSLKTELLIRRLCERLTRHVLRPTRMEVDHFYHANLENFCQPERIHAAHIIRNVERPEDECEARAILEAADVELGAGKPFAKVADRYSNCRGAGGSLGWIARGEMVDEFDDVVFALKRGEHSSIFRTLFGLHIATVLGRKPAGRQPLEEIRHSLALNLLEGRRQSAIDTALAHALSRSQIQVAPAGNRSFAAAEESRL